MEKHIKTIGIDMGSSKCMLVADDAEIILTSTGSISRPTMVSFFGKSRLMGEEAAPQVMSENTLSCLNLLVGTSLRDLQDKAFFKHLRTKFTEDDRGRVSAIVSYCDKEEPFSTTAVLAVFISHLYKRIINVSGEDIRLSFCLPPEYPTSLHRAFIDACAVANIPPNQVSIANEDDALAACYMRKISGIRPLDRYYYTQL